MTSTITQASPKAPATTTPGTSRDRAPLLLGLLSLALFLPGIHWGIPHATAVERTHAWGNDDEVPLGALAEMHNTFVISKPDRNIAYPWFHYFAGACAGGPYLLYLLVTGGLTHPSPEYPYGFADPVTSMKVLALMGRSISVVMSIATVLGAYYTARNLWTRTAGVIAAVLTMLMFPLAYYARVANPDAHVLGWTSLGLAAFAACLRHGLTAKRGALLGTCVAFAAATKDQSGGSFFLVPLALLWLHFFGRRPPEQDERARGWWPPLAALVTFTVVYILASGIPIDPARYKLPNEKLHFASTSR